MGDEAGQLTLDPVRGRLRQADIERVAEALRSEHRRIDLRVTQLLHSGWTGPAATAYAEGWHDWSDAAETVVRSLHVMGQLVAAAMDGIVTADEAAEVTSTDLYARLGAIS